MKRRINSLISVLMITIFLATSIIPSITANADTRTKLATPTNVRWIDGTTATLAWDAVPNAHHYSMEIYKEDGSLSGSASTIDASTSLDM
ncbi:MAG: hypothetical protein J5509_05725, partial [Lachnospiraceae bacterium]|nr:hypothetical protein [Lachnospiraceae bacterium]